MTAVRGTTVHIATEDGIAAYDKEADERHWAVVPDSLSRAF
ncbi:hypothetical protein WJ438_36240 [Streptomyces sp. GD-15H]